VGCSSYDDQEELMDDIYRM